MMILILITSKKIITRKNDNEENFLWLEDVDMFYSVETTGKPASCQASIPPSILSILKNP